jgi:hypothetical protein
MSYRPGSAGAAPGRRACRAAWTLLASLAVFAGCDPRDVRVEEPALRGTLAGRVTDASTGAELDGATVRLVPAGLSATTDRRGQFRLGGAANGFQRLQVERTGFNTRVQGLVLPLGQTATLDLPLTPASLRGSISGRVIDAATGAPVPRVTVLVPEQASAEPLFPSGSRGPIASAVTDSDGRFTIGPLGAGRTLLELLPLEHAPILVSVDVPPGGVGTATLRVSFSTGAIAGTVFSTRGTVPLTGAQVSVGSSQATSVTDGSGRYRISRLAAGTQVVEFAAPSHDRLVVTTTVLTRRDTGVAVRLRFNRAAIAGRVVDGGGNALAGVLVSVPQVARTTRTDMAGAYDFGFTIPVPDPPVPIAVGATLADFIGQSTSLILVPGENRRQDFALFSTTGNLTGLVRSAINTLPVTAAVVQVPAIAQSRVTDAAGRFSFFAVPATVLQLNVIAAGFTPLTTFVPVLAGQTSAITIDLAR